MTIVRRMLAAQFCSLTWIREIHISDLPKMIDMKESEKAHTSDVHEMTDVNEEVKGESLDTEYGAGTQDVLEQVLQEAL